MKLLLGIMFVSVLFLGSCDIDREPPRPGPYGQMESELGNIDVVTEQNESGSFLL